MRVFLAVRHARNPHRYYGDLWARNFIPALERLGHEVIEPDVDLEPASDFMQVASGFTRDELAVRGRITERLLDALRDAHARKPVDLFLSYFYNSHFDPAGFDEVERMGIPAVNFYCNSIYQFDLVDAQAHKARWSWHAERDAGGLYRAAGGNPVWVQMAADPQVYRPADSTGRQPRAVFAGARYADRDRWLAAGIEAGLPIDIYGSRWPVADAPPTKAPAVQPPTVTHGRRIPRPGSPSAYLRVIGENIRAAGLATGVTRTVRQVRYRKTTRALDGVLSPHCRGFAPSLPEVFGRYEVVLNFSNVWADGRPGSHLVPHVRLRDFEAPMCRSCYLTGHTDEIAGFYEIGREIDTYSSHGEFVDKIRYYLANPDAAERLRSAGYDRARRDHTWECRFRQLFRAIGIGKG